MSKVKKLRASLGAMKHFKPFLSNDDLEQAKKILKDIDPQLDAIFEDDGKLSEKENGQLLESFLNETVQTLIECEKVLISESYTDKVYQEYKNKGGVRAEWLDIVREATSFLYDKKEDIAFIFICLNKAGYLKKLKKHKFVDAFLKALGE